MTTTMLTPIDRYTQEPLDVEIPRPAKREVEHLYWESGAPFARSTDLQIRHLCGTWGLLGDESHDDVLERGCWDAKPDDCKNCLRVLRARHQRQRLMHEAYLREMRELGL